MDIFEEIKNRLSLFKNLYDYIRIVDPINKKVIISDDKFKNNNNNEPKRSEEKCFASWKKNSFCDNCISMRAYIELDTIFKVEHCNNKIILIIATPVIVEGITYVVELIKEINQDDNMFKEELKNKQISQMIYEINEKAIKDEMTGAYNRRYINERLPIDINNHILQKMSISIIMADIDFFKNVNDNFGHLNGDLVLKEFVQVVNRNIRDKVDWIGRFGGEEFLIILSDTDLNSSFDVAERVRKDLESHVFLFNGKKARITASFGVIEMKEKNITVEEAITIVDNNLYQAKISGRNRTCKDNQHI